MRDQYRRAAGYVDRILKREKPADRPVQQSAKVELIVNLKKRPSESLFRSRYLAAPTR